MMMEQNRMILGLMLEFHVFFDFIDNQFGHSGGQWQPVVLFLDFDPGASNIDKRFFIFHWCINVCFCYTRIAYW